MEAGASFGEWVQLRRKALDLTREQVARCAGCSVSALRKIEGDERRPSRQLAELLADCLRIPEESRELFIQVARGQQVVFRLGSIEGKPPQSPAPSLPRLPHPPTPLIGRATELDALSRLLASPQSRLVTIIGPGGIGKSRLALALAAGQERRFPDGVFFVSLAPVTAAEQIPFAIADTIGFAFSGPLDPKLQLLSYLTPLSLLLVLDNMEHLLDGAGLLTEILQQAPAVKLLATSRERLNLSGEWVFDLQGLPAPPAEQEDEVDAYSAVELFVQSARRVRAGFELSADERRAVAHICRLVEGMPLALELAAAWVRLLSCAEIAAEIERGLDFLAGDMRDAPPRQRSLRAAFDHSWFLLADAERRLLCRLAVFRGGFDRHAAAEVAGATLPVLSALVDKSLLRHAGERYELHEIIRQYAMVHLSGEGEDEVKTRDRHADHYLGRLRDRESALRSSALLPTLRELLGDYDNGRIAWDWAISRQFTNAIAPAVRSLGCLFELVGWLSAGIRAMQMAIEVGLANPADPMWRQIVGECLAQQGLLLFRQGHFDEAKQRCRESLDLLRPIGDPRPLTPPLLFLGVITFLDGDLDRAQVLLEELLACARATGERWYEAYAVLNLGYICALRGDYEPGYRQMSDGLALWRDIGDPRSIALGLNFRSPSQVHLGRFAEAEQSLEESLALCRQVGDRWGLGTALRFLGMVALAQGDAETARSRLHEALRSFIGFTTGWDIAVTLIYLGEAARLAGELDPAQQTLRNAFGQAMAAHSAPLALDALAAIAEVHLAAGAPDDALRLALFVAGHPAATHETRSRAERQMDAASGQLDAQQVCAAQEWAAAQSLETIEV